MPVLTVTTTPQSVFKNYSAGSPNNGSVVLRVASGATGTVYFAQTAAECIAGQCAYFSNTDTALQLDAVGGNSLFVCTSSGTVSMVFSVFGPELAPQDNWSPTP